MDLDQISKKVSGGTEGESRTEDTEDTEDF
jgi:hypothetical protein